MKFFLVGAPGVGKSTIIQNVATLLREKGFRVGGVACPEIREGGSRVGFEVVDLLGGRRGTLSHVSGSSGPHIGKYRVNLQVLSQVGVAALDRAVDEADVIVIDEVGPMELQGKGFQEAVVRAVGSPKPVLGILHWRLRHPIIDEIKGRNDVKTYEVTRENRGAVQAKMLEEVLNALRGKGC